MAIGFFLLIPFSVCTAAAIWLVAAAIYNHDAIDNTGDISGIVGVLLKTIPLIPIIGGLPIALGVLLLRKGLKLLRRTIPPVR